MAERRYNYKKNMTISKAVANRTAKKKAAKKSTGIARTSGGSMLSRGRGYSTRSATKKRAYGEPANRRASDRRLVDNTRAQSTSTPSRSKGEPASRGKTTKHKMKSAGYGVRLAKAKNKTSGYGEPPSRTKSRKTPKRAILRRVR